MPRDASKIILNLGGLTPSNATRLARQVGNRCYAVFVDDAYDLTGGDIAHELARHTRVGVNMKLHDKPEVVARRARALAKRGAQIITVQALGGESMMSSAVNAVYTESGQAPTIYATLPSLTTEEFPKIYGEFFTRAQFNANLSLEAKAARTNGVICQPKIADIEGLRDNPCFTSTWIIADLSEPFCIITPQIAIESGADYVIVGYQVTEAANAEEAFHEIEAGINPYAG